MALIGKKELCELAKVNLYDLANYHSRGKIVYAPGYTGKRKHDLLDPDDPVNVDFINGHRLKKGLELYAPAIPQKPKEKPAPKPKQPKEPKQVPQKPEPKPQPPTILEPPPIPKLPPILPPFINKKPEPEPKKPPPAPEQPELKESAKKSTETHLIHKIQAKTKQKQLEKLEIELRLSESRLKKVEGDLIPYEDIRGLVDFIFRKFAIEMRILSNKTLSMYAEQDGISSQTLAHRRQNNDREINNVCDNVEKAVRTSLKSIVESSTKKEINKM